MVFSKMLTGLSLFFMMTSIYALPVNAEIQCYECHGTKSTLDFRPMDSAYRNISTGGFKGNHQTHMDFPADQSACDKCHPGSAAYTQGHRDGMIKLSSNINSSLLPATYKNTTSAFPQTATPVPGTCASVNCHFEKSTPTWGAEHLNYPAGCGTCHGSPPAGTVPAFIGGAAGSHGKHDLYYAGASQCRKCHSDHRIEPAPFAHATTVGRRDLVVRLHDPADLPSGTYNGLLNDYLPSQTNTFGTCTSIYCHSRGTSTTSLTSNVTPTWGTPLQDDCSGCHGGDRTSLQKVDTGSHLVHTGYMYYGFYAFDCSICHSTTATDSRTINDRAKHVNQQVDVVPASGYGGSYSTSGHLPGGASGTCNNNYCHSNVQNPANGIGGPTVYGTPQWGTTLTCGGCHQGDGGHSHNGSKMSTGSHTAHLNYSFTVTSSVPKCMICHRYTDQPFVTSCGASNANTVCHWGTSKKHANRQVDVVMEPMFGNTTTYHGTPAPGDGYSYCTTTYCHGNGTSISTGTVSANTTPDWGTLGPLACTSCHGFPPGYPNGAPKANSHHGHLKNHHAFQFFTSQAARAIFQSYSTVGCNACHAGTSSDGLTVSSKVNHVNRAYTVIPSGGRVSFSYTSSPTGGSCLNISCHKGKSATWGVIPNDDICGLCHPPHGMGF